MDAATLDATSTGVIAPAAGDGGSPTPAAAGMEPGTQAGEPAAPAVEDLNLTDRERAFLSGMRDERTKRQEIEAENAALLARANQFAQPTSPVPAAAPVAAPAAPQDPFDGIDDDEIMTAKDVKQRVVPFFMSMIQQVAGAVAVSQRQSQYTDVSTEDIRSFIPKIVQEDPAIGQVLSNLPGPAQFMMAQVLTRLAKRGSAGPATPAPQAAPGITAGVQPAPAADPLVELARTILANSQKPGAPGSAGGGAMDDVVTLLKNMSPEQYEAYRIEKRKSMGL